MTIDKDNDFVTRIAEHRLDVGVYLPRKPKNDGAVLAATERHVYLSAKA